MDDKEPTGVTEWLGGLFMRALDQGFTRVMVDRERAGGTALTLGYHGERNAVGQVLVDELQLGADDDHARAHFQAALAKVNSPTVLAAPAAPWMDSDAIELLARQFLLAHVAKKRAEALGTKLLAEMKARGRTAIDVDGLGAVVLQKPSERQEVDRPALERRLVDLVDQLAALGVDGLDANIPLKKTPIGAHLKVVPAAA